MLERVKCVWQRKVQVVAAVVTAFHRFYTLGYLVI